MDILNDNGRTGRKLVHQGKQLAILVVAIQEMHFMPQTDL